MAKKKQNKEATRNKEPSRVDPPVPSNDDRAEWAESAITAFMEATGVERGDALCDLLADLRHWSDKNQVDWQEALERAYMHYEAEIEEANEQT